jgi:hypothetical protein
MLLVSGVAGAQWYEVQRREAAAQALVEATLADPCFGAASLPGGAGCRAEALDAPAWITPIAQEVPWFTDPDCEVVPAPVRHARCVFGDRPPSRTVALVGDSHAEHWRGALHRIARERNWELVEYLRGGCPVVDARVISFDGRPTDSDGCRAWGRDVDRALREEAPDYVFTSAWASAFTFEGAAGDSLEVGAQGFADVWTGWAAAGAHVFVLRDVPGTGGQNVPECLATHRDAPLECARPRSEAIVDDPMSEAAARVAGDRIELVDLNDHFCDQATCYAAVGRSMVYFDRDHMSALFSWSLGPYLEERISGSA